MRSDMEGGSWWNVGRNNNKVVDLALFGITSRQERGKGKAPEH